MGLPHVHQEDPLNLRSSVVLNVEESSGHMRAAQGEIHDIEWKDCYNAL